jgi:hypothetical protein
LESFYRSCFIILKYYSLDFVAARRVEAWDFWAKNLDYGFKSLISSFLFSFNHCKTVGLEVLDFVAKESYHLTLNLFMRMRGSMLSIVIKVP